MVLAVKDRSSGNAARAHSRKARAAAHDIICEGKYERVITASAAAAALHTEGNAERQGYIEWTRRAVNLSSKQHSRMQKGVGRRITSGRCCLLHRKQRNQQTRDY